MKRPTTRLLQALASLPLLLFLSVAAAQQPGTRNLSGTVSDHQHEPLRGAVVQVENSMTLDVLSYITNRDGKYSFKRLKGNTDYRVWVDFRGRRSRVRKLSQFDSDQPETVNFVLRLY